MAEQKKQGKTAAEPEKEAITTQERKVLNTLRKLDYGEVRIVVQASEIVQIVEQKSIKV